MAGPRSGTEARMVKHIQIVGILFGVWCVFQLFTALLTGGLLFMVGAGVQPLRE